MLPAESNADGKQDLLWQVAEPLLAKGTVSRGTMMGQPCLLFDGDFVAMADFRTGDLIVKLAENRVSELIETGDAERFAPAGRVFRQWAQVVVVDPELWMDLLNEAVAFAGS